MSLFIRLAVILSLLMTSETYSNIQFIAHRGQSSTHKENSVEAIKAAVLTGFDYIEIDVHRTYDGHIVAIHDDTLDRTTKASGYVKDISLRKLKEIDPTIPTLVEVYELLAGSPSKLIIEFKNENNTYPEIELESAQLSKKHRNTETIFKAFQRKSLDTIKRFLPNAKLIYCTVGPLWKLPLYIDDWLRIGSILDYIEADYVQVHKSFLSKSFINKAHEENKNVIAWDVQTYKDYKMVKEYGVDLIETDHPPASLTLKPSFSK